MMGTVGKVISSEQVSITVFMDETYIEANSAIIRYTDIVLNHAVIKPYADSAGPPLEIRQLHQHVTSSTCYKLLKCLIE